MNWTMNKKMKSIVFRVRKRYYDLIVEGDKTVEYRKDSRFWRKRLHLNRARARAHVYDYPEIAVFICGKRVHRRKITDIKRVRTPTTFSEQGKKDVPTLFCFAIHLGEEVLT